MVTMSLRSSEVLPYKREGQICQGEGEDRTHLEDQLDELFLVPRLRHHPPVNMQVLIQPRLVVVRALVLVRVAKLLPLALVIVVGDGAAGEVLHCAVVETRADGRTEEDGHDVDIFSR
jgi:hypothetical protein